jgi:hypothetical protein
MSADLNAVLSRFSETTEPIDELEISTALRSLRQIDDMSPPPEDWLAEIMAFEFSDRTWEHDNARSTYYGPTTFFPNQDGTVSDHPSITPAMLKYWQRRASETNNPVMKSRYSDLVWDFSKTVTGKGASVTVAHTTIESTISLAARHAHKHDIDVFRKLQRALSLALGINDSVRVAQVAQCIIDHETAVAEDNKPGLWGYSFDFLLLNKKVPLSTEQENKIITDLENRLKRVADASGDKKPDPWAAQAAATRLASLYRQTNRPDDVRRVLTLYGAAFEKHCETGTPLQISFWLQQVHAVYLQYGLNEDAERIACKIRDVGPDVVADMKEVSYTTEVPAKKLKQYVDGLTEGSLPEVLVRLAAHYLLRKDKVGDQLRDLAGKAPLSFLFGEQPLDHKGRPIANVGSLEDDLDGNIVHQMSQNMVISSSFLHHVLAEIIKKFNMTADNLLDYIYESPLFQDEKRAIIKAGLSAYFEENHLVAIHLLVPQIEEAIRHFIEITGGSVLKQSRDGGLQLKMLDELLRDERVSDVFGGDAAFYFRVVLSDQRGWNVRNNVCHGLLPSQDFNHVISERLLHVLLRLALARPAQEQQTDKNSSPP